MHPPRYIHPNYIPNQTQWRPHGPRFGQMWQRNSYPNSKGQNFPHNNEEHWCETCDRGFRTVEELLKHKQQHQKCNIDGCQFIAHPKVITKHIQMQHSTGLYKKIAKLDNPEEVKKWIEERKRRYPTKENIEKRTAEVKEKIDRGEKMGMRTHRENKLHRREQGTKRKYNQDTNRKNFKRRFQTNQSNIPNKNTLIIVNKPTTTQQKEKKLITKKDDSNTLKPFTGILSLLDDTCNDKDKEDLEMSNPIEEDEYIVMDDLDNENNSIGTEPIVCGALSSLMTNYESSDEESIHNTVQLKPKISENLSLNISNIQIKTNEHVKNNKQEISEKSDDDSGPEELKIDKDVESNMESMNGNKQASNLESSNGTEKRKKLEKLKTEHHKNRKNFKSKLPSTLLEKLLRSEIRQERNMVLQCIRYIVKNNYFEKSKT